MKIRWCVFTSALMIVAVLLTLKHKKEVSQDPPGVTTRWWDGTVESREERYSNGQLSLRIEYGDDGKTVLSERRWRLDGKLELTKVRLKDGRIDEKVYFFDGKTVVQHTLWNGDGATFQMQRRYHQDGKLQMEVIMTEDGLVQKERRIFDQQGNLMMHARILGNADQETLSYRNGKVASRNLFSANGDMENTQYDIDGDGQISQREKTIKLTGATIQERFVKGELVVSAEQQSPRGERVLKVFSQKKLKVRQTMTAMWGDVQKVEEFSTETGLPTRTLHLRNQQVTKVELFRKDGTLEKVKIIDFTETKKTIEYDAEGKKPVSEKEGGDKEEINPKLLQDLFYSTLDEPAVGDEPIDKPEEEGEDK